jgi:hypothetical protein
LFGAALLAEAMIARMRKETPASKRKRAARHAHGRLQVAEEAAHAGDALRAYAEISEAITAFASDKSGVALRGLTMDDARQALADRGAPDDLIERMVTELEHCDFARFAPGGQDAAAVSGALERAGEILSAIEAWRVREVA